MISRVEWKTVVTRYELGRQLQHCSVKSSICHMSIRCLDGVDVLK